MAALPQLMGLLGDIGNAAYTPEPNPAYGAKKYTQDEYMKANNITSASPDIEHLFKDNDHLWLSPDGRDVTHEINTVGLSPNDPYIKPGGMTKFFSSSARDIAAKNAQAEALPGQAGQLQNIQNTTRANQFDIVRPFAPPALQGVSALQGGALTEGGTTPGILGQTGQAIGENQQDVPGLRAAAALAEAKNLNFSTTHIDPLKNQVLYEQFKALYGREPILESTADQQALNELYQQKMLVPQQQQLQGTLTGTAQNIADIDKTYKPLIGKAEDITGLYQATHPGGVYNSPFNARLDLSRGTITPGRQPIDVMGHTMMSDAMGGGGTPITGAPSGNTYIMPQRGIDPLVGTSPQYDANPHTGQLIRDGIPIDDNNTKNHGNGESFLDANQAHKPTTTGQRLLQGIRPTIASGFPNPNSRAAQLSASIALRNKQNEAARIQELTAILTNPPTHTTTRQGRVSTYTHDQLQSMADELDKLLGE